MKFGRAARSTVTPRAFTLLCITVGWTLLMHAGHMPAWLSMPLALVLLARWVQGRGRQRPGIALWIKLPLVALLVVAIISAYGTLFGRSPGATLAAGLLVLKVLESDTRRDGRSAIAFAFFTLMSALLFDQGLIGSLLVGLGLLPALATLRALQPGAPVGSPRRELLLPAVMLLISAPLALTGFLFVPRLSTPLWGGASGPEQAPTGLADHMTPGNFTQLLVDDSPALRVAFDGPPPPNKERYFRAYVMQRYDGRSWAVVPARGLPAAIQASNSIAYRIDLEPNASRVLPALDVPLEAPPGAHLSRDHELLVAKPVDSRRSYRMHSALHYRLEPRLGQRERRRDLQLPRGYNPRTHALADAWRTRYGSDHAAIVNAALKLFHDGGFVYTLSPPPLGRNSIDEFLFSTKQGFCEHYSSSFTVLMRAAGVPARVVTGYQGGYWNDFASYLLVRNSDAHAWSEVWLAGQGWVRVDPTAAVRPDRVSLGAAAAAGGDLPWYQAGWARVVRDQWDLVNRLWNRGVVGFDTLRQQALLTPFGVRHADWGTLAMILALGCTLLLALAGALTLWRRPPRDPLAAAQRRLQRRLARLGIVRGASEGPRDYLQRAARALPDCAGQLQALSARYLWLRYGESAPARQYVRDYAQRVREFRPRAVAR
ncbi:MAG TPA: DUF3488 and transglutaminase-like domain-containing protein [Rhodanobacteraceae bacterium]|nr:DUF3488 and transglutaminase-like domain-containing protein [Rhodanobacteraceae bacterium]